MTIASSFTYRMIFGETIILSQILLLMKMIVLDLRLRTLGPVCMKCQILFPEKTKKNISKGCLLKFLARVLSAKDLSIYM